MESSLSTLPRILLWYIATLCTAVLRKFSISLLYIPLYKRVNIECQDVFAAVSPFVVTLLLPP
jgi:hypothetical protein